jgi:hypothetical protein
MILLDYKLILPKDNIKNTRFVGKECRYESCPELLVLKNHLFLQVFIIIIHKNIMIVVYF